MKIQDILPAPFRHTLVQVVINTQIVNNVFLKQIVNGVSIQILIKLVLLLKTVLQHKEPKLVPLFVVCQKIVIPAPVKLVAVGVILKKAVLVSIPLMLLVLC